LFHHEGHEAATGLLIKFFLRVLRVLRGLISFWFQSIRVKGYRWFSAKGGRQMLAICGLAANIVKKVLKINDLC